MGWDWASPIGSWFTIVLVFDKAGDSLQVYYDGTSVGQVSGAAASNTSMYDSFKWGGTGHHLLVHGLL